MLISASTVVAQAPVTVKQLPGAVQQALHRLRGNQPVIRIMPREIRGRIVYDIELDVPRAVNRYVRISGSGELLADTRPATGKR
jgi:hypothetical protein